MSKRKITLLIIAAALVLFIAFGFDARLRVRHYAVESDEISARVRICLVTDLHSCRYGDGQKTLIDALDEEKPDIVLLGGDIFDDNMPDGNTEIFLQAIAGRYPCYYVTGNHECWCGEKAFSGKMEKLEKLGITRLSGETADIEINGERVCICGIDDPDARLIDRSTNFPAQLSRLSQEKEGYTVLLSHRPEKFEEYVKGGFDLVLCGHAHGGQWRIPLLLNGLAAPNQGLFPKYAGGRYESGETTMIVSRGLARESTRIPRFYNRPELVIIDVE